MIDIRNEWDNLTRLGGSRMNKITLRKTFEWILLEMDEDEWLMGNEILDRCPVYVKQNCTTTEMGAILKLIALRCPNILVRQMVSGGRRKADGTLTFLDNESNNHGTFAYRKPRLDEIETETA